MGADKNSLVARDAGTIAQIMTLRFNPLAAKGGSGSYLHEEDGRRILDLSASATAASLGYGHPAVIEAITKAASDMAGASLLMIPNEPATALAESLLAATPGKGERRVWYGHS
ncbi:MAG: aminotransferase class III-fold pyridoxal phosphate-dependent enzyme, partial [Rhodospirillaceae bacterium]|nr:aminotransferase class III-fold pyridoxal phosphate-dependent enzyme [Rhodospirillaceae bacterium]